ncbi:MAG: hypothetical protein HC927_01675 [Deltaproteobacteria bacterium]|nr:hypothetical protein [Deltaproteobacteria bacterium]
MARVILSPLPYAAGLTGALALTLAAASGCNPGDVTVDDEAGESAEEDDDEGTDTGEEQEQIGGPALGIDIIEVEANQGTAVAIGKDGEWVGAEGRNAYMIRDRDTLIRVNHTVAEGWIPRELVGVLHIYGPDGVELEPRTRRFMVEADSDPRDLNSQFYFQVLGHEALPGTKYKLELFEGSLEPETGSLAAGINVTPPEPELIGYETTPLEMKVMLVPIEYTYPDPPTLVEFNEADLQLVEDDLLQTNPLQKVTLLIHEPYTYSNHITNLGQLLSPMAVLRQNEAAEPNVYYHALVDVRSPSVNMVAGIAQLPGDSKNAASQRVAATVWFKANPDALPGGSSGTIVHEIGHNQGLSHIYCPNAATPAAGPDPSYPHEAGKIGVYGFGIRNFRLYTPTGAHDYMTYCGNAWVSDWTWNKTYQRIETLTSWDYEGAAGTSSAANEPLLVGTLYPDGSEEWWAMLGPLPTPEQRGEQRIVMLGEGGQTLDTQYAAVTTLSDGETLMLFAPLTVPFDELEGLARIDAFGDVREIAGDAIVLGQPLDILEPR